MKRIAIGGLGQETNGFAPGIASYESFLGGGEFPPMLRGEGLIEALAPLNFGASGFIAAMRHRHRLLPLTWSQGGAGPRVADAAYKRLAGEMLERLDAVGPVDAVYLDLHGALATESIEDAEGELLARFRARLGPDLPIVASMDLHGNLGDRMVEMLDGLAAYRTYPHTDREEAGQRAAAQLEAIFADGRPVAKALRRAGFLLPALYEATGREPSLGLVAHAARPLPAGVTAVEYTAGWAPADVADSGPAIVVMGHDAAAVARTADEFFAMLAAAEPAFAEPLHEPAEAVRLAMEIARTATRPVLLVDTQDNPGGGGTGDTTGLLVALIEAGATGAALAVMNDAEAVRQAHAAGLGAEIDCALGGRSGPPGMVPVAGRFRVKALSEGRFPAVGQVMGGRVFDLGPTALLGIGGVDIVVAGRPFQTYEPSVFGHLGLDAAACRILALKSTVHYQADFAPMAERVIVVRAPGWHLNDLASYPYRNLRPGTRLGPLGPAFVRA